MRKELKKDLLPIIEQINDTEKERSRVEEAKRKCVINKGYNGCWNCDIEENLCTVNQTMKMVEGKSKLLYVKFYNRVVEWLKDA